MQHRLKPPRGAAGAQVIPAKLFHEFFLSMDDSRPFSDAGFGGISLSTFTAPLESTLRR
jgi:hypothetical protein